MRLIVNDGRRTRLEVGDEDRPSGGIRSAALALCMTLARRGHEVHLFGLCPNPGTRNGVGFHDRSEFARFTRAHPADALILIPDVLPLLMPAPARARVVWTGNAFVGGDCALTVRWTWAEGMGRRGETARLYSMALLHPYADGIFVVGQWQGAHVRETLDIPASKFSVVYNGVALEYYRGPPPARHRHRLVYTSQARRGLDVLLRIFPRVRAAVPEAELHIFTYEQYDTSDGRPDLGGLDQPGVYWRGRFGKSEVACKLRCAGIMAYPCTIAETFCTSVAEAQAAGLPVVTSERAALTERVSDGVDGLLIPGKPRKPGYQLAFLEAVVRLLRDDDLWTAMGREAAKKAHRLYDWDAIAMGWEEQLERLVAGREPHLPRVDPGLDLLDPSLLTLAKGEARAQVPPALAEQWLRIAWTSYGYDPHSTPGLRRGTVQAGGAGSAERAAG